MCKLNLFFKKNVFYIISIILFSALLVLSIFGCGGGGGNVSSTDTGNSAVLTWNAPTTNEDGTPLTDLAGYKIYYGMSHGKYTKVIDVGNITRHKVKGLEPGAYYFVVTAYDTEGNESTYSNEVSKKIE